VRGFFLGFFFLGLAGAAVCSCVATVGAASGFAAALFLLNDGKPNQPLDCGGSFVGCGLGGGFVAVTAGFGGGAAFVLELFESAGALALVPVLVSAAVSDAVSAELVSLLPEADAVGAVVSAPLSVVFGCVLDGDVDGAVEVSAGAVVLLAVSGVLAGLLAGLTFVIIHVAIPIPANTKIATATPAISMPALPFFGGASTGSEPSSGMSRSTNVGSLFRFLPVGGCARSLPEEIERLEALAVGEAISVPACAGFPGTPGERLGAPGAALLSESGNILPKSTGADEVALVHGTESPAGAPGGEPGDVAGEPGSTGEMRELEVVDEAGGGACSGG
jgi:hypothetical protein